MSRRRFVIRESTLARCKHHLPLWAGCTLCLNLNIDWRCGLCGARWDAAVRRCGCRDAAGKRRAA